MDEDLDLDSHFPDIIREYENKWVAIAEIDGEETVVGSGDDATAATLQAKAKGFPDTLLFKVPSFRVSYAPLGGRLST
jgi:Family of unknown function (DUF5678)